MKILDPQHPFFRPAWRRYLMVAACFAWAGVEQVNGNGIWALLFAAIGGFLAWELILTYKTPPDPGDD